MLFSNIIGYQTIKRRLEELVATQSIPQVSLILGDDGSPVLSFARSLATYLHCTQKTEKGACGVCSGCQKSLKTLHPDLYYLFPIGNVSKSKKSSLSAVMSLWRTFLEKPYQNLSAWASHLGDQAKQLHITTSQIEQCISFVRTHPLESRYKVVILYLPENMSLSAANKLLKTLEEPPSHTYFILVSHDQEAILPTVSSRTSSLTVPPFNNEDLFHLLKEKYPTLSTDKLRHVTQLAKGDLLLAYDLEPVIEMTESFSKSPPTKQKAWIRYALRLIHTTLIAQSTQEAKALTPAQADFCQKLGKTLSFSQLEALVTEIEKMRFKLGRNAHPKLLFLATSLRLENIKNNHSKE